MKNSKVSAVDGINGRDKLYLTRSLPRTFRVRCEAESDLLTRCWFEAWSKETAPVCAKSVRELEAHIQRVNRILRNQPFTMSDVEKTCFRRIDVGYGSYSPAYDSDITYFFHNGRLLWIDIMMWSKDTDILYPQLRIAYGSPTSQTAPLSQNRMGATFQNRVAIWDNGEDVITLRRYDGTIKYGRFSFTHRSTLERYQAAKAAVTRDAAKDF